jgi:serine/threonine protein kinase
VGVGTESRGENTKTRTLIGTVAYLSPELFQAYTELKFKSNYNPYKSDTFSLALVFLYFGTLHRFDFRSRTMQNLELYKQSLKALRK